MTSKAIESMSTCSRSPSFHSRRTCWQCSRVACMGRNTSPRKPTPASRSLSSRLDPHAASSALRPFLLDNLSGPASLPAFASSSRSQTPASDMPAQKRSIDEASGPSTPNSQGLSKNKKRRARRSGEYVGGRFAQKTKRKNEAAGAGDEDLEEGEVVEGNFDDLFMVDTTPAAVKEKDRFVGAPTPLRTTVSDEEGAVAALVLSAATGGRDSPARTDEAGEGSERSRGGVDDGMESDEAMRIFAKEVAMTDDEDEDGASSAEDDEQEAVDGEGLMLYDNEEELEKAIQGRIVDDSAAPVRPLPSPAVPMQPDPKSATGDGTLLQGGRLDEDVRAVRRRVATRPLSRQRLLTFSLHQSLVIRRETARIRSASSAARSIRITRLAIALWRSSARLAARAAILRGCASCSLSLRLSPDAWFSTGLYDNPSFARGLRPAMQRVLELESHYNCASFLATLCRILPDAVCRSAELPVTLAHL